MVKNSIYKLLKTIAMIATAGLAGIIISGCGNKEVVVDETPKPTDVIVEEESVPETVEETVNESLSVDVLKLQEKNSDIWGWITVPGTSIDGPLLQSYEEPDMYKTCNADKENDGIGAAYIEIYNMPDMCDFNTVIHGSEELFKDLVNFENPDFFEDNYEFYIYLPDNVLTYTIWAVYRRENKDLFDAYSFADAVGAREFLDDVYNEKVMGKQIREGWNDVDEYKFLTTLTIDTDEGQQLVVIGALTNDAAGNIDREVIEYLDLGPILLEEE